MGCQMTLKPEVTAITFVALGTSLPDTFASKASAVNEPTADNSLGNITGSNSVNVFLGLGLPWMIAAIYWSHHADDPVLAAQWHAKYADEPWHTPDMAVGFAVPAGQLGYSVAIFTVCALICLGTLMLRRSVLGFERARPCKVHTHTHIYIGLPSGPPLWPLGSAAAPEARQHGARCARQARWPLGDAPRAPPAPYLRSHAPLSTPPRLGGPEWHKNVTVVLFVFLWFFYIALSAAAA